MTNADRIEIESDERGFELHVWVDEEPDVDERGLMVLNIQGIDLDTFYDQVKGRIGPYLQEKEEAFQEFKAGVKRGESARALYDREVYDHERQTGQHAPFVCSEEDVDESGAYDHLDPKHPAFHSTHADIWDSREGK